MPKVSVIVTTYNRKEYLTETIQSILNQTYQDFELIVVDNYSNYDFFALIESFNDKKIIPLQNHNNGVIAANRNFGIKNATGEYIAFCDDDDIWVPEKLQLQIESIFSNKADLVYSNTIIFFESGAYYNSNYRPTNSLNYLLYANHITLSSVVVRNDKLVNFNEDTNLTFIEDYELWLRLIMNGFNFHFDKTPLVRYRVIKSSYSNLSRSKNELKLIKLQKALVPSIKQLGIIYHFNLLCSMTISHTRYFILKIINR